MSVFYPQRLLPRHVRFLKLLPGLESDPIQCELIESELDKALGFEALSYVWGDAKIRQKIECVEGEFSITANLYQALHHLRQPNSARLIWADAICINQDDIEERNQQVQLMRGIYSRASRVVVWLGLEDGEDVNAAITLMKTIYVACSEHAERIDADLTTLAIAYQGLNGVTLDQLESLGDHCTPKHPRSWLALRKFFARPWFTRVWCIQEIALARDSIVLVGGHSISWNMVGVTACWLTSQMSESDFDGPSHLDDIDYYNAYCMFDDSDRDELDLLQTLAKYRDFESTDPKDKVYGLLGLVQTSNGKPMVDIEYKKSLREVYLDVALMAIKSSGNLAVLSYVKHGEIDEHEVDIPSWVPRWDTSTEVMMLHSKALSWSSCGRHAVADFSLTSTGGLNLRGIYYDSIEFASGMMDISMFRNSDEKSQPHIILDLWNICSKDDTSYPSKHQSIIALALILTSGVTENHESVMGMEQDDRSQFYADFAAFIQHLFHRTGQQNDTFPPAEIATCKGDWQRYKVASSRVCDQRRFFRTTGGIYGIGPAYMGKEDIVVVLYGGKIPYVLRPMGAGFKFLGECYVDTIMFGEAFQEASPDGPNEHVFSLL